MPSISVTAGKFLVLRTDKADGANPHSIIISLTDGAAGICKDVCGFIWCFRSFGAKLQYCKSTDVIGSSFSGWVDIVSSDVADGSPGSDILLSGRIEVVYFKTDNKLYRAYTDNQGINWIINEEVVT